MKRTITLFLASVLIIISGASAGDYSPFWQQYQQSRVPVVGVQHLFPSEYKVFSLADAGMKSFLWSLSQDAAQAQLIDLPMPDGSYRTFRIWETPLMQKELAAKYPEIKTFTAVATDDKFVTAKIDYTPFGFHAMIFERNNTSFIDPYTDRNEGYYLSYYKKDYKKTSGLGMTCEVNTDGEIHEAEVLSANKNQPPAMNFRMNGDTKKTYRLALACTGEYAVAVAGTNPTKPAVLAKMIISVNRVTGIYERELAVSLSLIANTDTLIFLDGNTDPYTNNNGGTMLGQNQTTVTARIGTANYDMGHVFSTGGGGIANKGCICSNTNKARGVTGLTDPQGDAFDVDYVAHEMGHQFGADHTFNASTGSCSGNGVQTRAYEPGSGTTIMAYAGICGSANDLQPHSDPYFHAASLEQIHTYITTGNGGNCPVTTPSGNTPNTMTAFSQVFAIPFLTPFELTAPKASDATADTLTYCWEQWNLGEFGDTWANIRQTGPIFRSFLPDTSRTRIFPQIGKIVNNISSYLGEKLPDTSRMLRFKLTTRDVYNGIGSFNFPDDTIHLDVIYTTTPFTVSNPNTSAINWTGGTNQTVTWNVSSTDVPPISCSNVDIYLSIDGGYTYPIMLRSGVPNTGFATIVVPNIPTVSTARIKVKGNSNVFFDISNENFTITYDPNLPNAVAGVSVADDVKVFPVPAEDVLHIVAGNGVRKVIVVNAVGQQVFSGTLNKALDIQVASWAKGVYYLRLVNEASGQQTVKPVVVQ